MAPLRCTKKGAVDFAPGIWNVMPTRRGDHMSLQGRMFKRVKVKNFYLELARMLATFGGADSEILIGITPIPIIAVLLVYAVSTISILFGAKKP